MQSLSRSLHPFRFGMPVRSRVATAVSSWFGSLEPGIARLNAGTTAAQLDAALTRLFESEEPPARGAATRVPGQILFGGFDLHDITAFYLTVDLRAGNYVIVAEDAEPEDRPNPPLEIINIRVA